MATRGFRDVRGNLTTAASPDSVRRLDEATDAYLGARTDARERLERVLAADPTCVLGHCLDGYLGMLSSKREGIERAREASARARAAARRERPTQREVWHVAALDAWSRGDMRSAVAHWDGALADAPRDLVALRVSQFVLSYLGESERMRDTVARVIPAWDAAVPGYGFLLGCYAYGLEEAGDYAQADAVGREAVAVNPCDIWAAHAVTHVAEMEGRLQDGVAWIATASDHWRACNNFAFHLRWHEALFNLDLGLHGRVLDLYDREIRRQSTDESLDVTNAVSLLWRLEQAEVDVGPRWGELAERARDHMTDHALVFVDLHYLMALAAAGTASGAIQFLESCERFAEAGRSTEAAVMAEVGLPLARAILAHRRGNHADVVELLMPVRHQFRRIGGSHAQRDLFDQLLIDAAWRGRRLRTAAELLAERTARRPRNIWGWTHRSIVLDALGADGAGAARRTLDQLRGA